MLFEGSYLDAMVKEMEGLREAEYDLEENLPALVVEYAISGSVHAF